MTIQKSFATRPAIAAGTYTIDPSRTTVRFAVKEMWGLMTVRGGVAVTGGTVTVGAVPGASSASASLDLSSFASGNKRRDKDVTGPSFLDAGTYPAMEFTSTGLDEGGGGWTLRGTLAARGTTAPVTLRLVDGRQTPDGCAFTATARVDRTALGVRRAVGFIARHVDVTIEVTATAVR